MPAAVVMCFYSPFLMTWDVASGLVVAVAGAGWRVVDRRCEVRFAVLYLERRMQSESESESGK